MLDEMKLYADPNDSTEAEDVNSDPKGKANKKDFLSMMNLHHVT